jgi:orotate phosphoribosyltransferase
VQISSQDVQSLFEQAGAYLSGHFLLTSGLHSPNYLQCALVLQDPARAGRLGQALASLLEETAKARPDLVIAPALGGLIIGHEVARALGVPFLFTERDANRVMTLRRGFTLHPGQKVYVVEDVITTGGSTREVVEVVEASGAVALAAGSIVDRSDGQADVGVPRVALWRLSVQSYPPEYCPLCDKGVPVVKPGSRFETNPGSGTPGS